MKLLPAGRASHLFLISFIAVPLFAQEAPTSEQLRLPDDVAQYRAQLAAKETSIAYWRVQFQQAVTKANALQFELERIWACVNADKIPGYDQKTGDPVCTERPKPPAIPTEPAHTTPSQ